MNTIEIKSNKALVKVYSNCKNKKSTYRYLNRFDNSKPVTRSTRNWNNLKYIDAYIFRSAERRPTFIFLSIVSHVVKGPVKSLHAIIRRLKDFDLQNEIVTEKTEKLLLRFSNILLSYIIVIRRVPPYIHIQWTYCVQFSFMNYNLQINAENRRMLYR